MESGKTQETPGEEPQGKIHVDLTILRRYLDTADVLDKVQSTAKTVFETTKLIGESIMVLSLRFDYDGNGHVVSIDVVPARTNWVDAKGRDMHAVVVYNRDDFYMLYNAKAVVWVSDTMDVEEFTALVSGLIHILSYRDIPEVTQMVNDIEELLDLAKHGNEYRGVEVYAVDEGGDYNVIHFTLKYFEGSARLEVDYGGEE